VLLVAVILIFRDGLATTFSVARVTAFVKRLRTRSADGSGPSDGEGKRQADPPGDQRDRTEISVGARPIGGGS
jgi:hypothetical protein